MAEENWKIGTKALSNRNSGSAQAHTDSLDLWAWLPALLGPSVSLLASLSCCSLASWMIRDPHLGWGPSDKEEREEEQEWLKLFQVQDVSGCFFKG